MSTQLNVINPIDNPGWDDMLLAHKEYSFFHSSAWAKVLADAYGFVPAYFTIHEGDTTAVLVPVMDIHNPFSPRKGVSLPFTDTSSPIIDAPFEWRTVYDEIIAHGRKAGWKYFETRGDGHVSDDVPAARYYGHRLNLSGGENAVYDAFANGTKGNIRKAVREGVEVSISSSMEALRDFFRLHALTRKRHGLPPQPFSFFDAIYRHVLSAGKGFTVIATLGSRPIAGAMFFHFGSRAIYKYAASDMAFQHVRANNLVMWEAIRRYCGNGIVSLDLGRTELDNEGLRYYKAGWGAEERIVRYHKYDIARREFVRESQNVPGIVASLFRNMPVPLLNAVGSVVYRYAA
jgi:hypothetical protein